MRAAIYSTVILLASGVAASAITINTVPVGKPGNAADATGYGAVSYEYRIGTTEVTNAQYAAFLNAKAASDPLALYDVNMSDGFGGITRSGADGSYTYTPIAGRGNMPVVYVNWFDSLRFIIRGGSWNDIPAFLNSSVRGYNGPADSSTSLGFRVATIPEPSTVALAAVGLIALASVAMRRVFRQIGDTPSVHCIVHVAVGRTEQ